MIFILEQLNSQLRSCTTSTLSYGPVQTSALGANPDGGDVETSMTIHLPPTIYQTEQYVKSTFSDLMGNIGGYLGLFLGVSLLQAVDLLNMFNKFFNKH